MYLKSYNTKNEYNVYGPVYENTVSKIWCGTSHTEDQGDCFIKILKYGELDNAQQVSSYRTMFNEEINTMKLVNRCTDRVPKLFDNWDDRKKQWMIIVMQKMPGTTLRQWMTKRQKDQLTTKDVFVRSQIIKQICDIMLRINKKYPIIVHRDLKPENIFVEFDKKSKKWVIGIIDFGCANLNYIRNVGTLSYQAPEQKKKLDVGINSKTDIFAIGQIFYELLIGYVPRIDMEYQKRARTDYWEKTPIIPDYLMKYDGMQQIESILENMTRFNAEERSSYTKIIRELTIMRIG